MTDNDAPVAWPVWTPGAWMAGLIKRTTIRGWSQNIEYFLHKIAHKHVRDKWLQEITNACLVIARAKFQCSTLINN